MAKTALQLLNEVAKNVRRSKGTTYTALDQDQHAVSFMQAINEAKRMVEDAWKWDALRVAVTFNGAAGTHAYDTSDSGVVTSGASTVTTDRAYVLRDMNGKLQMWDVTDTEYRLQEVSLEYAEHIEAIDDKNVERPSYVAAYNNGEGVTFKFPWAPSGVRNYKAMCIIPQEDLAATGTELLVPWRPVVLAATALAIGDLGVDERREDRYWKQYDDSLGKAIGQNSDEFDMVLVPV